MNPAWIKFPVFVALFFINFASVASNPHRSIRDRFETFNKVAQAETDNLDVERARLIAESYDSEFPISSVPRTFEAVTNDDIKLLFYSADIASFYTTNRQYSDRMARYLKEMTRRKIAPDKYYYDMFGALVSERRYADAARFANEHPQISFNPLPELTDNRLRNDKPSALFVASFDKLILSRKNINMDGSTIVMVAHPLCHFSQNAISTIVNNPKLKKIFANHSILIAPVTRHVELTTLMSWNKSHPNMPMALAFKKSDWPMFDSWETPTFYFFEDGNLIDEVVGWPAAGHVAELLQASRKIGLLKYNKSNPIGTNVP